MKYTMEHYEQSAAYRRERIGAREPEVLLILGSGLGFLGDRVEDAVKIPLRRDSPFPVLYGARSCGVSGGRPSGRQGSSCDAGPFPHL